VVLAMTTNTAPGDDGLPEKSFNQMQEEGFAVFPSVGRASTALFRVYNYYRRSRRGTRISA
jgi:hypothetical protein